MGEAAVLIVGATTVQTDWVSSPGAEGLPATKPEITLVWIQARQGCFQPQLSVLGGSDGKVHHRFFKKITATGSGASGFRAVVLN